MDIQMLNRRELQALCKLNKIPANITNVAMVNALNSLDIVVGIEDIMKPSESLETTESSPARTEIMSPRIPRTSYRTSTRKNPVQEGDESVPNVTRTTRRAVRQIAGEVEDANTATEPKTPAAASTRRRAPAASARKNMETQLNEESMDQEKKCVPLTPAAAVEPTSRRKGPAATTTQRANLKEDSMYGRTYRTRRSARLTEVKVAEPSSVKKENKEHEKTDLSSTQRFKEMLDKGSDGFNAVAEDSSLSVGIEWTSEYLEPEKEKTAKNDVLESIRSNNMEIDVIPSEIQNPIELNKLENVENPDRDMGSEETITEVTDKTDIVDDITSENENPSDDSKVKTVENFSSPEDMASVEVAATKTENLSNTLKQGNFGAFEDMDSDEKKSAVVMENVVLENNVENPNEDFEFPVLCPREDLENEFVDEEMYNESVDESITKDVRMKTKKENDQLKKGLKDASLRQLTKMLKNQLQITNSNAEETEKTATRAALQTLSSNSLAATQVGN